MRHPRTRAEPRPLRPRRLAPTLLATLLAAPSAIAAPIQVPPITNPASQEHHTGKPIFAELITPDIAAAKTFYGALFGWTFQDMKAGTTAYAEASLNGAPIAGLVQKPIPPGVHRQPAWLTFLSVQDVDAADKTAAEQGAKVLVPPHTVADRGRETILADPQGAVVSLLTSSSGDPPDLMAAPGAWIWSTLVTTDPQSGANFYKTLLGYDVITLPAKSSGQHLLLATENYARASVNALPADRPSIHPHWLDFIHVTDAAATTAKVASLGGSVLVAPWVDRQGGKMAIIADPQGAPFGVMEWPEGKSKRVAQ